MYIRFVTERRTAHGARREGFLQACYEAVEAEDTPENIVSELQTLIKWFETNLVTPPRFNRTNSKGAYRRKGTALSWFTATAEDHIDQAFAATAILGELGHSITVLKTDRPGYVLYEDDFQVIAQPLPTPT
ncbi:MAG: hypothetical protein HZT43_10250 [Exiguobacterium profundum]|nr:MAG: hypothetical protein HZT43_10250 [Exiguobacterium profundum]